MHRMLKVALEGEPVEVVEGMFIGVPIGVAEDIEAISTESFGEAVKNAGKKVWEMIVKLCATVMAAIKAFINHIFGKTSKDRGMNDERRRQYELLIKKFKDQKPLSVEDKIASVIKSDQLDEKFLGKLNESQKSFLTNGDYKDAMTKMVAMVSNDHHRTALVDAINAFINAVKTPGRGDEGNLETIRKVFTEYVEPMHQAMAAVHQAIDAGKDKKAELPEDLRAMQSMVTGTQEWLKDLGIMSIENQWKTTFVRIEAALKKVELVAHANMNNGSQESGQGMMAVLQKYWELLKGYMSAINMIRTFESSSYTLIQLVIEFRKDALERTRRAHPEHRAEIDAELDAMFSKELEHMFRWTFS